MLMSAATGDRRGAYVDEFTSTTTDVAIGFGEATMNTLQRLSGFIRHSKFAWSRSPVASVLI